MAAIQPTSKQRALYDFVIEHAPVSARPYLRACIIPGAISTNHLVAYSAIGTESEESTLILSLPEHSSHVYLAITDQYHPAFCDLIARFDAESESNDALTLHFFTRLHNPFFNQVGWYGAFFIPVSELIADFPKRTQLAAEDTYTFQLMTLITEKEFEFAQRQGAPALLAELRKQKRDFLKFVQPEWRFRTATTDATIQLTKPPSAQQYKDVRTAIAHSLITRRIQESEEAQTTMQMVHKNLPDSQKVLQRYLKRLPHTKISNFLSVNDKILAAGELILGAMLFLVGGFASWMLLKTDLSVAGVFSAIFAFVGLMILLNRYRKQK